MPCETDVMGTIPGHIHDEVIILGNHRDGSYFLFAATTADPS